MVNVSDPLSLYVHIPFCDHRCAYCDFNAYAGLDALMPRYVDALAAELAAWVDVLGPRPLATVYFGGGTPSRLPLPLLERLVRAVEAAFPHRADTEWSLEANPGTIDEAYLRGLRALGINRLSIGVQSFDDAELRLLDRIHDAAAAETAYRTARAAGFANVNLDLMFGLQGQDLASWERTLRRALALGPEHLSLYALTVEEGTPLARQVACGQAPEPDPDLQAAMYERAQALLAAAGYEQYEISNWARPGYACRHNLVYWRDGEWLGVGAGAHSHLAGRRFAVVRSPAAYVRRVLATGPDRAATGPSTVPFPWVGFVEEPEPDRAMADYVTLALRLSEGLSLSAFAQRFGVPFEAVFGDAVPELTALGLLVRDGDRLCIPPSARFLAGEVQARVLAARRVAHRR
jgi:oxygen-independent coproporphyrinogen-3 oxidase